MKGKILMMLSPACLEWIWWRKFVVDEIDGWVKEEERRESIGGVGREVVWERLGVVIGEGGRRMSLF